MEIPEEGIAFLKNDSLINSEPSAINENIRIPKYKLAGESIIYDKVIVNDNFVWLSYIDENNLRQYCNVMTFDNIIIAPLRNGIYCIENYFFENNYVGIKNINNNDINIINNDEIKNNKIKALFEFIFEPKTQSYFIQSLNSNKCFCFKDSNSGIELVYKNLNNDLMKWKIINTSPGSNIYTIQNLFLQLIITMKDEFAPLILDQNLNLESQKFYIWEEFKEKEFNGIIPLQKITRKATDRKINMEYAILEKSIKFIEQNAFKDCIHLEEIKCSIKFLEYFRNNNIKKIEIIDGDESIKNTDFIGFENISVLVLPDSLKYIEENTFRDFNQISSLGKTNLKFYKYFHIEEIVSPPGETKIKREIFFNTIYLKRVKLPNTIKEIEEGAFENSGIEEIILPEGIQVIPQNTFKNCKNLRKISLPESIINISNSAFINCEKLNFEDTDNVKVLNKNLKNLLKKELNIIEKEIKSYFNYTKYIGIESINISVNSKFKSDKEIKNFFSVFYNIIKGNFSPDYLKYANFENLIYFDIPKEVIYIPPGAFDNCRNLEYLNILGYMNPNNLPDNIFINLTKLKEVLVPDYFHFFKDKLFGKCYNLKKIKYLGGFIEIFKTTYKVDENIDVLIMNNLLPLKNLGTLIIPKNIKEIEPSKYELSGYLECVECDPKWLIYLPIYQLKKVIVPEFVDILDEQYFEGGEQIEEIIFKGKTILAGNFCKDFENAKIFRCFPSIGLNVNDNFKKSEKDIYLNENTEVIGEESFSNWIGLKKITFPNKLKIIEKLAFYNCINLIEIEIPDFVEFIDKTSFENCINLRRIIINGKFLSLFPTSKIQEIILKEKTKDDELDNLKKFQNLELLIIPRHIKFISNNIISNLPKLRKIKCCLELLNNLTSVEKEKITEIEIYEDKKVISKNLLTMFKNLQDVRLNKAEENINILEYTPHETDIDDIINFDKDNNLFKNYILNIYLDINQDEVPNYDKNDILGKISYYIVEVCSKIKRESKVKKITPHLVQILSIIRLLYEILTNNKKGALAQISTGEGKSYIIAVVAIILAVYEKRYVDIVTSNLELAFRDEKEQSEYYQLFNLKSGVLCSENGDEDYIKLYKPGYRTDHRKHWSGFYTHVLEYPIIYSANFNYEFLHLYSFCKNEIIRKRPYDVVIVDEVDNMLIDQMSSPSIIGNRMNFYQFKKILKDMYNNRNLGDDIIFNKLKKYSKTAIITKEMIERLKISAR